MLAFRAVCAVWALAALGAFGCANLPTVPPTCGNGVVESGEDCDQTDATTSGDACGQMGTANQCRFICDPAKNVACPASWVCGLDGACKLPIPGSWTAAAALVPQSPAIDLLVADFDSDGVDDVAAFAAPTVDLHFFETTRTSTESTSLLAADPAPAIGSLTASTSTATYGPSLTLDLSRGLAVFTGQTDRSLSPAVYASVTFPGDGYRIAPYLLGASGLPYSPTGFFAYTDKAVLTFTPPNAPVTLSLFTPSQTRIGSGVAGRFTKTQGCEWLALALNDTKDGGHVHVYSPCDMPAPALIADVVFPPVPPPTPATQIPGCESPVMGMCPTMGPTFHPVYTFDVDGDGLVDLVVVGNDGSLHVGYSYGNAHFGATPPGPVPGIPSPDNTLSSPYATLSHAPPLAIGNVAGHPAGSGLFDVIDPSGVYLGAAPGAGTVEFTTQLAAPDSGLTWSEAVIADLDGDGILDVAVGSAEYSGITLYRGTDSPFFNEVDIVTSAPIKALAVGDFDGDFVNDLAFAAIGPSSTGSTPSPDTVYMCFGTRSGPPADPAAIGDVTGVSQIVASVDSSIFSSLISDAFVVANDPSIMPLISDVYLFPGDASRQIEAPYYLLPGPMQMAAIDGPRRSVVGSFTGRPGLGDIAVFAQPVSSTCPTTICDSHLWLLQTQGDAVLESTTSADPSTPQPGGALPGPFDGASDVLIGALDPASGSNDQVVMAMSAGANTSLVTATAVEDTAKGPLKGSMSFMTGAVTTMAPAFDISGDTAALTAKLLTVDVDGDGHRDLVLASTKGGLAVVLWSAQNGIAGPTLMIPYEGLVNACGALPPQADPNKPKALAIGAAAFKAGTYGKGQAIVTVVSNGAVLVVYDGKTIVPSCLTPIGTGTAVAVGDFDGDGIEDIVVSQSGGLEAYYGGAYGPGLAPAPGGGQP